jgi:hypothetical protein
MNRRVWQVLLIVVALIAVVPRLPDWSAAAVHWARTIDMAATVTAIRSGLEAFAGLLAPATWLWTGVTVLALSSIVLMLRRRKSVPVQEILDMPAVRHVDVMQPAESALAVARQDPMVPSRLTTHDSRPTTHDSRPGEPSQAAAARRWASKSTDLRRPAMVRQLLSQGHSVADIARATGIGQDGIRSAVRGSVTS